MANNLFRGKSTRTKIFTVISCVAIILLLIGNIFITSFGIFGNFYIDLTPEGLYTVRKVMYDVCDGIMYMDDGSYRDPGIKMTFCDDPDNLIENTYTRVVYYMALQLAARYDNFEVETVNVAMNPTAVAKYKSTSLAEITSTNIIISYGERHRIADARAFWVIGSEKVYSFDGEYKLASIMMSLTLVDRPKAYFVTDHGEDYYRDTAGITDEAELAAQKAMNTETSHLFDLLTEKGLEVDTLSLSKIIADAEAESKRTGKTVTPSIPDDCVVLIINDPKTDFSEDPDKFSSYYHISETELIDRYMVRNKGSVMIAKDYKIKLPVFEDFLTEWGLEFSNTLVKDTESSIKTSSGDYTDLITEYITEDTSYAYQIYKSYASLASAPRVVVSDTGYIKSSFGDDSEGENEAGDSRTSRLYVPFIMSSAAAIDYSANSSGEYIQKASDASAKAVAAIGSRKTLDAETANETCAYMFAAASASFFSTEVLGNPSYANYEIVSALVQDIARLETFASDELGGLSPNNNVGFMGKPLTDTAISEFDNKIENVVDTTDPNVTVKEGLTTAAKVVYTVIIALIPTAIAVTGIVICIKRKFL